MEEKLLNEEDYKKILANAVGKNVQFLTAEIKPISDDVEGFMGEHYFLKINYKNGSKIGSERLFIKTSPVKNKIQSDIAIKFDIYKKEIFFYDYILKDFEDRGYDTSFASKNYYCKDGKTIILENLKEKGYELSQRGEFYGFEKCKAGLRALAKYHAASFAAEKSKSKELGRTYRFLDEDPHIFKENLFTEKEEFGFKFIEITVDAIEKCIDFLPKSDEWKKNFMKNMRQYDHSEIFLKDYKFAKTCGHGDLWSNNMMFKTIQDKLECVLLDFQVMRYFWPVFDIVLFIFSNTRRKVRDMHLQDMYKYYYSTLEEILRKYGYELKEIIPLDHFYETIKLVGYNAKLQAMATRSFVLLPKENLNSSVNDGGDIESMLFEDRPLHILEACKNDSYFREIFIEDCYELYETLENV